MIGIVGGTGGPRALVEILARLPRGFAAPILVIMDMPVGYLGSAVAQLSEKCPLPVTSDGVLL